MTPPGSEGTPILRVAIVGSGPAGFYVAERLFKREEELSVEIDMYDRLPTPFGLVRFGVAPDHEKIKNVTRVFEKLMARPNFNFFGNVDVGEDVSLEELAGRYHQICFATGAQTDRRMDIPGEDLAGSHPATEFVAWYNAHPDFRDRTFNLAAESVAVIGVGNVAVDVARILCRTREELAETDVADHALDALARSSVKRVYMIGRRGPAQAAFTNPEVKELGELPGADLEVISAEVEVDALSASHLEASPDKATTKKLEILSGFVDRPLGSKPKRLTIRFLASPVEIVGDEDGRVKVIRLVKNELYETDDGSLRPRATAEHEEIPVQLVFRSVGYRGVPITDLPFDESWGIVPNQEGRVVDPESGEAITGIYVAGWIKRGPSGVIGTNKPDGAQTADCMIEDARAGRLIALRPEASTPEELLKGRGVRFITYEDWRRIDELESARGEEEGRPRVKFDSVEAILAEL